MRATRMGTIGLLTALLALLLYAGCKPRPDYSTPKKAVRSFYVALVTDGAESAKVAVTDSLQAEVLADLKTLITHVLAAQEAAEARFGKQNAATVSGGLPSLDDIDQASETIEGDTATLTVKSHAKQLRLKKVDGQWKLDVFSVLGIAPKDKESARRMLTAAAQAAQHVAQQIKSGQYKTADDASAALNTGMAIAVAREQLFKGWNLGG
jgi:hypothetical protein